MAAKKTHDVVATVGEYKTQSGETKKRYVNCGSAFTNDDGNISIKLDTVPVGPDWSGWLSLYAPKDRQESRPAARQAPAKTGGPVVPDDDDVPFSPNYL